MQLIAKQTVGADGAASVTFSSIPQTFTDLKVVVSGRASTTTTGIDITFNGSTTGYSNRRLYGTGSGVASDSAATTYISNIMINDSSYTANTFGNGEVYIPNYTSSNNDSLNELAKRILDAAKLDVDAIEESDPDFIPYIADMIQSWIDKNR